MLQSLGGVVLPRSITTTTTTTTKSTTTKITPHLTSNTTWLSGTLCNRVSSVTSCIWPTMIYSSSFKLHFDTMFWVHVTHTHEQSSTPMMGFELVQTGLKQRYYSKRCNRWSISEYWLMSLIFAQLVALIWKNSCRFFVPPTLEVWPNMFIAPRWSVNPSVFPEFETVGKEISSRTKSLCRDLCPEINWVIVICRRRQLNISDFFRGLYPHCPHYYIPYFWLSLQYP